MESLTDKDPKESDNTVEPNKKRFQTIILYICGISLVVLICLIISFHKVQFNTESDHNTLKPEASSEIDNSLQEPSDIIPWELILVNFAHPLPEDYKPILSEIGNDEYFDERALESLLAMLEAAEAQGLTPLICSAYRDEELQTELFNSQIDAQMEAGLTYEEACKEAKNVVASPGTSEHSLGLAVDIVAWDYQLLDDGQAQTAEAKWLTENCQKYGFILRYPPDKNDITGIIYEPWHYRYVGVEAAQSIMKEGLCLEEYLEAYY